MRLVSTWYTTHRPQSPPATSSPSPKAAYLTSLHQDPPIRKSQRRLALFLRHRSSEGQLNGETPSLYLPLESSIRFRWG